MRGGNEEDMAILNRASEEGSVTGEQPTVTSEQPTVTGEQPAVTSEQPTVTGEQPTVTSEQPIAEPSPQITKTIGDHVKNVTRKATNWLKGWFGIGEQTGGKRRYRKHRKTMKKARKNKHH
jgi:hypothetical protein